MAAYVRFGLPCAAVWVVYLLAFWPGILTEDSIEQWTDMTSGVLRGYHSPLQTTLHWLLTRLWFSPAIIESSAMSTTKPWTLPEGGVRRSAGGRRVMRGTLTLTMGFR